MTGRILFKLQNLGIWVGDNRIQITRPPWRYFPRRMLLTDLHEDGVRCGVAEQEDSPRAEPPERPPQQGLHLRHEVVEHVPEHDEVHGRRGAGVLLHTPAVETQLQ